MTDLDGWFPFRISVDATHGIVADWFRLGEIDLRDDVFFADTVARCARHPFNLAFCRRTGIAALETSRGREPDGLIFHLSRCGSTLAARMLAATPRAFVVSEPGPINDVVTLAPHAISDEGRVELLRAVARTLSERCGGAHDRYVIKLDAWHARSLELFERAFPHTPWVYLYRDPLEVLVSHLQTQSYMMSAANAPAALGMPVTEAIQLSHGDRSVATLAAIGDAILARSPQALQLVNYNTLAEAVPDHIAPRFGIDLTNDDRDAMRSVRTFHAKRPGTPFSDDRDIKRDMASPELREIVATRLGHIHHALEKIRTGT